MLVLAPWVSTTIDMVVALTTDSLVIGPCVCVTLSKRVELNVALPLHSFITNPVFVTVQDVISVTEATARPLTAAVGGLGAHTSLNSSISFLDSIFICAPATFAAQRFEAIAINFACRQGSTCFLVIDILDACSIWNIVSVLDIDWSTVLASDILSHYWIRIAITTLLRLWNGHQATTIISFSGSEYWQ